MKGSNNEIKLDDDIVN